MAEVYMTLVEFEDLMRSLTMTMLEWDGTDSTKDVRIAWPTSGAPSASIVDNMVYLQCLEEENPYNRPREVTYEEKVSPPEFDMETSYTMVMRVNYIIYGEDSFENAQRIRDEIFYPENRLILSQNNLYLIPDISAPRRVSEYFAGRWWKRADMSLTFNELVVRVKSVPIIESIEVEVSDSDGTDIADIIVNS